MTAPSLISLACSVLNFSAPSADYRNLICLNDRDRPSDMMLMSGCGLVVRGLLKRGGCQHEILSKPYRIGAAIADCIEIARDADCLDRSSGIKPGTILIVNNPVHIFTVVETHYDESGKGLIVSVDGGQRLKTGAETVCKRSRFFTGDALDGRPILHWIDGQGILDLWNEDPYSQS